MLTSLGRHDDIAVSSWTFPTVGCNEPFRAIRDHPAWPCPALSRRTSGCRCPLAARGMFRAGLYGARRMGGLVVRARRCSASHRVLRRALRPPRLHPGDEVRGRRCSCTALLRLSAVRGVGANVVRSGVDAQPDFDRSISAAPSEPGISVMGAKLRRAPPNIHSWSSAGFWGLDR
jgi:hypothetical protein